MNSSEAFFAQKGIMEYMSDKENLTRNHRKGIKRTTIYVRIKLSKQFYQWYDLDLQIIHKLIDSSSIESTNNKALNRINRNLSGKNKIIIDYYLLALIRFLQLIGFFPWFPQFCIWNEQFEMSQTKNVFKRPAFSSILCGLVNIGNTCFMSSAVQCLCNIPQLMEWVLEERPKDHEKHVTEAFVTLIKEMHSGNCSKNAIRAIKRCVSKYAPIFTNFAQKDSHEFMNSLLNALHSELETQEICGKERSIVTDLFQLKTESGVTCSQCGTYHSSEEATYFLPLPLSDEPSVHVDRLLEDFLKEEQLDGQYYCSQCQSLQLAKQKTSLCFPLPPVIIVQLKRFTFDETNDKLNTFVKYPISNWRIDKNDNSVYDLSAVSVHDGNLARGHYTAYARLHDSNQWYLFNDSYIEPVSDKNCLVTPNAYILVYLKKE